MATSLTRNLQLRIDSGLNSDAVYNLQKLDTLGSTFLVDTTDTLRIRSLTNITIQPNSVDLGGAGTGGTVSIGDVSHPLSALVVSAATVNISSPLGLLDQATGGSRYLRLRYKSDASGSVDTLADRNLTVDLDGADRVVILQGNLELLGGNLSLTSPGAGAAYVLPTSYGSPGQVLETDGTGNLNWVAGGGTGTVRSYVTTWAPADGLMKSVTHNLATTGVEVTVVRLDTNELIGIDSVVVTSANAITLTSSEVPAANWQVTVLG